MVFGWFRKNIFKVIIGGVVELIKEVWLCLKYFWWRKIRGYMLK